MYTAFLPDIISYYFDFIHGFVHRTISSKRRLYKFTKNDRSLITTGFAILWHNDFCFIAK